MSLLCPHSELDIKLANISLANKVDLLEEVIDSPEVQEIVSEMEVNNDKAVLNASVAAYQGITLLELINSPNYDTLINEYRWASIKKFIDILEKNGLSNKEAWALIFQGMSGDV